MKFKCIYSFNNANTAPYSFELERTVMTCTLVLRTTI